VDKQTNKSWLIELSRILAIVSSSVLFGYLTGQWLLSLLLHSILYLIWTLYQLWQLERWISGGSVVKKVPATSGIWQLVSRQLVLTHKNNKSRENKLVNMTNRYQAIMSVLPEATIILTDKLEIEWANTPSQEILGIDGVNDIGNSITNVVNDPLLLEFLSNKDQTEIEIPAPNEPQKALNILKIRYYKKKILLIARDVSQRIAIQKLRKGFISNASHELRTPLTVVSGYLDILDGDDDLPSEIGVVIKNALEQAQRMEKILDDLLLLSKLEEKGFSEDRGKITDIPSLLNRLVNDFENSQSGGNHSFKTNINPELLLKVKEQEFFSLCQNLLSNAVKYSAPASEIKVTWTACNNGMACLSVIDQGEGIPEKHLTRLTERFYRVNITRSRKVKGTGLGLSIVKHIIDNYGGYLEINSELEVGSSFSAYFPASRVFCDALVSVEE